MRLAFALAAAVLLAMILFPIGVGISPSEWQASVRLLAQASAAEARLFAADDVVSLTARSSSSRSRIPRCSRPAGCR